MQLFIDFLSAKNLWLPFTSPLLQSFSFRRRFKLGYVTSLSPWVYQRQEMRWTYCQDANHCLRGRPQGSPLSSTASRGKWLLVQPKLRSTGECSRGELRAPAWAPFEFRASSRCRAFSLVSAPRCSRGTRRSACMLFGIRRCFRSVPWRRIAGTSGSVTGSGIILCPF